MSLAPPLVIEHGHLVDAAARLDRPGCLVVAEGKILGVDVAPPANAATIDARDCLVFPGLIDVHVQLREPGFEEDETIESGTHAALAGGFSTIACLPNTDPPVDSPASVAYAQLRAARSNRCHVLVLACISKQRAGEQLAEMGSLAHAGAVAFTDGTAPVHNAELMLRAFQYAKMFDRPIMNPPEVRELSRSGVMHEGEISMILGLPGMPAEAEDVMVGRDLRLAEATGGRLHLMYVSTSGSVELIRRAKQRGVSVTCDVAVANLAATDVLLRSFDSDCKLNPPLRSQPHVDACIEGLRDGTIDAISSGHAPRAAEKKMCELDQAPFGACGLETTLPLLQKSLVAPGHLTWPQVIAKLTTQPAKILNLHNKGTLAAGSAADLTIYDPASFHVIRGDAFFSKSSNTPFEGLQVAGQVRQTIVDGHVRFVRGTHDGVTGGARCEAP